MTLVAVRRSAYSSPLPLEWPKLGSSIVIATALIEQVDIRGKAA